MDSLFLLFYKKKITNIDEQTYTGFKKYRFISIEIKIIMRMIKLFKSH